MLNWYFLKTVKANLISNGLTKYNKLVRFNQQIVLVSLLMDVMIIAAMSIPNSFVSVVTAQPHPSHTDPAITVTSNSTPSPTSSNSTSK
jgi:hypothetical protein